MATPSPFFLRLDRTSRKSRSASDPSFGQAEAVGQGPARRLRGPVARTGGPAADGLARQSAVFRLALQGESLDAVVAQAAGRSGSGFSRVGIQMSQNAVGDSSHGVE